MSAACGLLLGLLGPLAALLGTPAAQFDPAAALQPNAPAAFRQGTQGFRQLLHKMEFDRPLESWADLLTDPSQKLLIVLGDTTDLRAFVLHDFLNRGGAVLLATDRPWAFRGLRVNGQFVRFGSKNEELVEGPFYYNPECPKVLPTAGSPLFSGIPDAATNRPSFLVLEREGPFTAMAQFPFGCRLANGERYSADDGARRGFAAGADWGRGRFLVLADHSVFINDMLLRDDNNNVRFVVNCLTWLAGQGSRREVLFVEDGRIQTVFDESLAIPTPPPQALTALINSTLRGFEEEDRFNDLLKSAMSRWIEPDQILLAVVGLVTLMLVGYGFVRLGKNRHRPDKDRPRLAALLARPFTSAAVVELRHRAMLEEGNLWEAARALARQCFDGALGAGAEMSRLAAEWGEPPRVHVTGGWWRRWQVGQLVRRLWQLAYDPVPAPVSAREFTRLASQVRAIRAALEDGTVRIEPP